MPMITARRDVRISEGSVVTINYVTGSTHKIQSMSLPKRAVVEGQRALIIDDFMKRGGTLRGVVDLMREFSVTVVGMGVVMTTAEPERKLVDNCRSLMVLHSVDESVRRGACARRAISAEWRHSMQTRVIILAAETAHEVQHTQGAAYAVRQTMVSG